VIVDRQFTTGFKDAQPLWISSYQLLVHFQLFSGSIGPVCAHKQWFAGEDRPDSLAEYDFFCNRLHGGAITYVELERHLD